MNKIKPGTVIHGREVGFVYLLAVGNHYKIGKSIDVDGVVSQARRFDSSARLITCFPAAAPGEVEAAIHTGLKRFRVDLEQFDFPAETVQWIASLDDAEFGAWFSDTNFDERAIDWCFPRVYSNNTRGWSCLFVPESNLITWSLHISPTKPHWKSLELAWLQDDRGFRSVWLGSNQVRGLNKTILSTANSAPSSATKPADQTR